ncbi:MAG: DEAD/DEAH box helicase [Candidatus Nanoarchaeia archaeon]|jgi:ATP-dependent RNA helicase DeaD
MNFSELLINDDLIALLNQKNITQPTVVQSKVIPLVFNKKDVIVQAETGSGKTLCFVLPIAQLIKSSKHVQVLVVAPTRELALQVGAEFAFFANKLSTVVVYGGSSLDKQIKAVRRANIIVGTPGRLLDLINRRVLDFSRISFLVVDEVDELLRMGFINDLEKIIARTPIQRQSLMLSATISDKVISLTNKFLFKPERVLVGKSKPLLEQYYYHVNHPDKIPLLVRIIKEQAKGLTIVFCNTKGSTVYVTELLKKNNINADHLSSDLDQRSRERVLNRFIKGDLGVLVATDVAARGIHVDDVNLVINFDLPRSIDGYTHRVGRTARQGKPGITISIICDRDYHQFRIINEQGLIRKLVTGKINPIKLLKKV